MRKRKKALDEYCKQDQTFLKEAEKVYIPMSDGQEIFCQYSITKDKPSNVVFFFVQGFASSYFTWSDFWDSMHKKFNLVIVDPRDKKSNVLKKESTCTVNRMAKDFAEAIKFLNLKEEHLVIFGSSIGASYVAHLVSEIGVKPKMCFLTGPSRVPRAPLGLLNFFFMFPGFIMNSVGKLVARLYLMNKVASGFQKMIFYDRIKNTDVRRWKHCRKLPIWDAEEDFKKMDVPVRIILTPGDKYHVAEEEYLINSIIKECKTIEVPSYDFCHTKPDVDEFANIIEKAIKEIS